MRKAVYRKDIPKQYEKNCPQIKSGEPLGDTRTTASDTHFQFSFGVLNSSHLLNCNSIHHKYGKFQKSSFCISYGSAKIPDICKQYILLLAQERTCSLIIFEVQILNMAHFPNLYPFFRKSISSLDSMCT